jgi:glycosyltransferase involved in cell wall biosynthesis
MRVAVMQRIICNYQIPYYLLLNNRLKRENIDLKVFCAETQNRGYTYEDTFFARLPHLNFNVSIGGLQEKLVIMPTLFRAMLKYKPDVIVAEDISAMPNCITILLYSKLFKIPYIIWGPGSIPNKRPSKLRFFLEPVIGLYRNSAKSLLCYSTYAKDYYSKKYNKKCCIAYNSAIMQHSPEEYKQVEANICRKYQNPNQYNIVFIGRLMPQKKVDLLLAALSKIKTNIPVTLSVIGDGNIKNDLMERSRQLNITDKVHFLGEVSDRSQKARIFTNAHLGVLPGLGGLAIQEIMWHGIPVIASYADGTEQDLIVQSRAGIFIDQMDENKLCEAIQSFINLPSDQKTAMALRSLQVVYEKYNIDSMLDAFEQSITNINHNTNI